MGKKKGELEQCFHEYETRMISARTAQRNGLYRNAVKSALAAWEYIDGMMQYARRYEKWEFDSIEAIDLVLDYASIGFDYVTLDSLQSMLQDQRRIEKCTSADMGDKLDRARKLMWAAHRLWNHLERNPETKQDELRTNLGGDQTEWRSIAEAWEKMGLLRRVPQSGSYRLSLVTRLSEVVAAKCASCGVISDAPKAMWLEKAACPSCHANVLFVLCGKKEHDHSEN